MLDRVVICGKNGQVASALRKQIEGAICLGREIVSKFIDYNDAASELGKHSPTLIINASAYTNVDKAEEEVEEAFNINAKIPENLAQYCKANNIPLVHYSTDYVYSGQGNKPQSEDAPKQPLNIYGKSKLEGENLTSTICDKILIFRTSWVFDSFNKNFMTTMLKLGAEREELSIIDDQIGAPTYADDIAIATVDAIKNAEKMDKFPSGVYNLCNKGEVSWYEYAQAIFKLAEKYDIPLKIKSVTPIPSEKYKTAAKRPLNSRLNCSKAEEVLRITMPDWQTSLEKAIGSIKNAS